MDKSIKGIVNLNAREQQKVAWLEMVRLNRIYTNNCGSHIQEMKISDVYNHSGIMNFKARGFQKEAWLSMLRSRNFKYFITITLRNPGETPERIVNVSKLFLNRLRTIYYGRNPNKLGSSAESVVEVRFWQRSKCMI